MQALKEYVDHQNRLNKIFKSPEIDLNTSKGRQELADSLSCALSPENLACDGEAPRAQVAKKAKYLQQVVKELQQLAICFNQKIEV